MRKHEKMLTALMTMLMVVGMIGCGSTPAASSSEPLRSSEAAPPSSEKESQSVAEESEVEESTKEEENSELNENGKVGGNEEDEDGAEGEEEEAVANNSEGQEGTEMATEPTTSSIDSGITVCVKCNAGIGMDYALFLINPETGSCEELNNFSYRNTNDGYCLPALQIYDSNYRTTFSQDISKMAVTYTVRSTKSKHAGWLDSDGYFFDVPEALGMKPENEFVVQPDYYSIGFTVDGEYFVFAEVAGGNHSDNPKIEKDGKFYYVSLSDLSLSEGNPIADEAYRGYDIYEINSLTDWISGNEFLSNQSQNFVIKDAGGGVEDIEPIPGDSRYNRSAVVGPDGLIAFVSSPKTTSEDTAIYTTTRDGSNIQRVFDCSVFNSANGKFPNKTVQIYAIRWR